MYLKPNSFKLGQVSDEGEGVRRGRSEGVLGAGRLCGDLEMLIRAVQCEHTQCHGALHLNMVTMASDLCISHTHTHKPPMAAPPQNPHSQSSCRAQFPTSLFLSSPQVTPSNPTLSLSPGPVQGSSLCFQPTLPGVTPLTTTSMSPSVILQRQHYPLGGQSGHILADAHQPWDPVLPLPQLTNRNTPFGLWTDRRK